jgi:predicted nucleotidyltransferase
MNTKVNNTLLNVLTLFTKGYDKDYYIREVERLLKTSSRTALLALAQLEHTGILESRTRGKIKVYCIRKAAIARQYLVLAEQYKKIQFLENNPLIREVLEKTDGLIEGAAIIFGSYAKGIQKQGSDLDLFISGKFQESNIKDIGRVYKIDIRIKSYPPKLFEAELHEDILLREILENHVIIKGAEEFVSRAVKWTK